MKKKVTIVVPVYNSGEYIKRCIDSLLAQTYQAIEILVIDDGSDDGTMDFINNIAEYDGRIRLFRQKHAGPNRARKTGVHNATGEYIMFIDADDYIRRDAVSLLVKLFNSHNIDAIRFGALRSVDNEEVSPINLPQNTSSVVVSNDTIKDLLLTTYALNNLCFQIYKTKDIKKINSFDTDVSLGEDYLVNLEYYSRDRNIQIINDGLYYYCNNPDSTTRSNDSKVAFRNLKDRIYVSGKAISYADSIHYKKMDAVVYEQIKMIRLYINKLSTSKGISKNNFMRTIKDVLPKDVFIGIDINGLNKYIDSLDFLERVKNRRIINSIIMKSYKRIWQYVVWRRILGKYLGRF